MAERRADLAAYRAVLASRARAQLTYRTSFAADVLANVGVGISELATVYVVFWRVDTLGGLDVWSACLVFALANLAFALADLLVGHVDELPRHVREGTLDAFLLRPLPLLGQLATSEVSLRRLGRAGVALAVLVVALPRAGVEPSAATLALLGGSVLGGTAVFCALFVAAGALQFWLLEGREAANSFTYGGANAAQHPASLYPGPLRWVFTYVVPASFVAYLPVLALTGRTGPAGLPSWLGWCTPLAAVPVWAAALLLWRAGVRRYTGAGS
ncbi:ABC-2 family transporter protein [Paenibacillus sp. TRM 82003]|uniref:ABC transporter permease n=1 Tax=Kineococcus sp. TRM81007 TaxID=2925831 RepID=UPI001F562236|nr:ABC-2 family transporter protein [Kineococcus sp. TRM81007]MCI2237147.1 ABC-2 family transporter protein [Kineococcus sp. TRM81007]MCI3925268.1 ABC-2 family transporter protein [Paenibacillus sp. TRM 82003]